MEGNECKSGEMKSEVQHGGDKEYMASLSAAERLLGTMEREQLPREEVVQYVSDVIYNANHKSLQLLRRQQFGASIRLLKRCARLWRRHETRALAKAATLTCNNLSFAFKRKGQLQTALKYLKRANEVCLQYHESESLALTYLNMCVVQGLLNESEAARDSAKKAALQCEKDLRSVEVRLKLDPQSTDLLEEQRDKSRLLAVAYYNIGVQEEVLLGDQVALQWYKKARKQASSGPEADLALVTSLDRAVTKGMTCDTPLLLRKEFHQAKHAVVPSFTKKWSLSTQRPRDEHLRAQSVRRLLHARGYVTHEGTVGRRSKPTKGQGQLPRQSQRMGSSRRGLRLAQRCGQNMPESARCLSARRSSLPFEHADNIQPRQRQWRVLSPRAETHRRNESADFSGPDCSKHEAHAAESGNRVLANDDNRRHSGCDQGTALGAAHRFKVDTRKREAFVPQEEQQCENAQSKENGGNGNVKDSTYAVVKSEAIEQLKRELETELTTYLETAHGFLDVVSRKALHTTRAEPDSTDPEEISQLSHLGYLKWSDDEDSGTPCHLKLEFLSASSSREAAPDNKGSVDLTLKKQDTGSLDQAFSRLAKPLPSPIVCSSQRIHEKVKEYQGKTVAHKEKTGELPIPKSDRTVAALPKDSGKGKGEKQGPLAIIPLGAAQIASLTLSKNQAKKESQKCYKEQRETRKYPRIPKEQDPNDNARAHSNDAISQVVQQANKETHQLATTLIPYEEAVAQSRMRKLSPKKLHSAAVMIQRLYRGSRARSECQLLRKCKRGWEDLYNGVYVTHDARQKTCAMRVRSKPTEQLVEVSLRDASSGGLIFRIQDSDVSLSQTPSAAFVRELWDRATDPSGKQVPSSISHDCIKFFELLKDAAKTSSQFDVSERGIPATSTGPLSEEELRPLGERLSVSRTEDESSCCASLTSKGNYVDLMSQTPAIGSYLPKRKSKIQQSMSSPESDFGASSIHKHSTTKTQFVAECTFDLKPLADNPTYKDELAYAKFITPEQSSI